MAGITQGALAGSLFALTLTYFTQQRFESTRNTVCASLQATRAAIETRNDPVEEVSNINNFQTRAFREGISDIWNEEVIRAVNWVYDLKLGNAAVGLVESGLASLCDAFK